MLFLNPDAPWSEQTDWPGLRNSSTTDDEILIFGDRKPPRTEMDAFIDEILSTVMARSHPIMGPVLQRVERLYPHLWDLVAMKPAQQRKALRHPPYRDLTMANSLLDESDKIAPRDPQRAEEYAQLAQWIAELPWPDEQKKATTIRSQAFMAQGNALHLARNWRAAELRFGAAFAILQELPLDFEHSSFCRKLSRVREDQGRYYEAATLQTASLISHSARRSALLRLGSPKKQGPCWMRLFPSAAASAIANTDSPMNGSNAESRSTLKTSPKPSRGSKPYVAG